MKDTVTRAFILRAVDLRESDRLLTLLTPDLGKVSAVARGARTSRKRFGGALEPFALIEVVLGRGRRGRESLFALCEATLVEAHEGLARDLERLGAAAFVVELAREVTPEHAPDPAMFALVAEALPLLAADGLASPRALAAGAALGALALAGFAVSATACNACGTPVPPGRRVHFDPRRGGVVCTPCGGGRLLLSAEAAHALATLATSPLAEAARLELGAAPLNEVEGALSAFLEQHLPRPLRAEQFRRKVGLVGG